MTKTPIKDVRVLKELGIKNLLGSLLIEGFFNNLQLRSSLGTENQNTLIFVKI